MKTMSVSYELKTGDIKVWSNLTSINAKANRISLLEAAKGQETQYPSAIYVDFKVKPHSEHLPSVLGETEELDFVVGLDDAVQMGLLLLAMGLENKSKQEIEAVFQKLSELTNEFHN